MDYNYLVPANSKKQGLIFGLLNGLDAIILSVGVGLSFGLFLLPTKILDKGSFLGASIAIAPALIAAFLIFPIPNYHNTRTFIREMYRFYFVHRRKYIWRGWCYKYEQSDDEQ